MNCKYITKRRYTITLYLFIIIAVVVLAFLLWHFFLNKSKRIIENRYESYRVALEQGKMYEAYLIMSPDYRKAHPYDDFIKDPAFRDAPQLHKNHSISVYWSRAWLFPWPTPEWGLWSGDAYEWINIDGQWYMTGEFTAYRD